MPTRLWRRRWTVEQLATLHVLKHDNKLAIIIPTNLSHSWVRKLLLEAAKLYEYGNPYPTPARFRSLSSGDQEKP